VFAENTAPFLADFTVTASFIAFNGSQSQTYDAEVIFDQPEGEVIGGRALSENYTILYRTADLPGLVNGVSITVNGVEYEVIDAKTVGDGVFSRAALEL